jgi:hypothetical protein
VTDFWNFCALGQSGVQQEIQNIITTVASQTGLQVKGGGQVGPLHRERVVAKSGRYTGNEWWPSRAGTPGTGGSEKDPDRTFDLMIQRDDPYTHQINYFAPS